MTWQLVAQAASKDAPDPEHLLERLAN